MHPLFYRSGDQEKSTNSDCMGDYGHVSAAKCERSSKSNYTKHVGCNQLPDFLIVSRQPQITLLTAGRLEFDRAREQDVIFEMNMPVQIVLKLFEPLEEGTIGRTGIFRRVKITAQTTDLGE